MRNIIAITAFFSILLLSCGNKQKEVVVEQQLPFEFSPRLLEIDSLVWHDADSALMVLVARGNGGNSMENTVISNEAERSGEISSIFNENYHSLLLSEALYKTNNPQLNRYDLQAAINHFDSLYIIYPASDDLAFLSARSHYMNGVGFYENDSVVEACGEYLKTLEIMEEHFEEKEIIGYKARFMALTYNRLVDLFSDQFMMEPAIYCGKKSLHFCKIEPTSKYGMANTTYRIGMQYAEMNNNDSAAYYYNIALEALPDTNNLVYRNLVASMAINSYTSGHEKENSLSNLKKIIEQTDDPAEKTTRYLTIGYIFYEEKQYDSAQIYLEAVYKHKPDIISRIQAAEFLYDMSLIIGKEEDASKYANFLALNKPNVAENKVQVSTLDKMFQDYLIQKNEKKFLEEKYLTRRHAFTIIVPIALFVVLVVFLATRKWGRKRVEQEKAASDSKLDRVNSALRKTEKAINDLKMKMEIKQFADMPICKHLLSVVKEQQFKSKNNYNFYKDYALGKEQILELREAANLHYDNFTIRLKEKFPELTSDDIDYCCLYLLGLKDADVSALMQKDYSTVCYRSRKIKSILKSEKTITETLYNMAKA